MMDRTSLNLHIFLEDEQLQSGLQNIIQGHSIEIPELELTAFFSCSASETWDQAKEHLSQFKSDILFFPYEPEKLNPEEIIEYSKENHPDLVSVVITDFANIESMVNTIKNGANDFLLKPFTPDELCFTLTRLGTSLLTARHARKLEDEKKKIRFQFLSILSHELKSPLAAIESYLYLLDGKIMGDSITNYEKPVKRSLVRIDGMRKLIFDMLDLTRIESGSKQRELREINLSAQVREIVETHQVVANERNITLELSAPETLSFLADAQEIDIIFNNLISNAIKYNIDNGRVFVSLEGEGNHVVIEVKDTGIGMSKEDQEQLFSEFYRIKNEKTSHISGSGLGLSILQKISNLYNGKITLESEEGKGSSFCVTLFETPNREEESESK